jgi:hypothetical protein
MLGNELYIVLSKKKKPSSQEQWLMPIITATQEAEIGKITTV